jgi:hypothetical protein
MWFGMMCKSSDLRAVAKDAIVDGILDGRAEPSILAKSLIFLLRNKWLKLNRLAEAFSEISHVSRASV